MRTIRVTLEKAESLTNALREAGFQASWKEGAHDSLDGSMEIRLSDITSEKMATITTDCSGTRAHKLWLERGLVSPSYWER